MKRPWEPWKETCSPGLQLFWAEREDVLGQGGGRWSRSGPLANPTAGSQPPSKAAWPYLKALTK